MKETRIEIRLSRKEKKQIDDICQKLDFTLSDYVRRKLFDENEDLHSSEETICESSY